MSIGLSLVFLFLKEGDDKTEPVADSLWVEAEGHHHIEMAVREIVGEEIQDPHPVMAAMVGESKGVAPVALNPQVTEVEAVVVDINGQKEAVATSEEDPHPEVVLLQEVEEAVLPGVVEEEAVLPGVEEEEEAVLPSE